MHFELRLEGPAKACGNQCRVWVSASGAITADTPGDFEAFARNRNIRGGLIAFDSDGGSVVGAIALGRALRRLAMTTTVGKTINLASSGEDRRSALLPNASCGSMCTFVLLGGIERRVPLQARVFVHQIWLGNRRDDPTAATYSAEDLALVQRDVGKLAQYTMEMIGTVDLLEASLKIPPWEPMYQLSRNELRNMRLVTSDDGGAAPTKAALKRVTTIANGDRAAVNGHGWAMNEQSGSVALARRHPLTIRGSDVGSFDLKLSCGATADHYNVTYVETRTGSNRHAPGSLREVLITLGGTSLPLKIISSRSIENQTQRDSLASAQVPAALIKRFAEPIQHTMRVETSSADESSTVIQLGNAGFARNFPDLTASCDSRTARHDVSAEIRPVAEGARETAR